MIIFNAFLFIFSTQFGFTEGKQISSLGYNISNPTFAWTLVSTGAGLIIITGVLAFLTKNIAWFGAGAIMSLMSVLWNFGNMPIYNLLNQPGYDLAIHIWTIFQFIFYFLCALAIVEIFTGRSVDD